MEEGNRRRHERTPCPESWTDVSIVNALRKNAPDTSPNLIKVKLENISSSGVCIISEKPFELDQMIQFHDDLIQKTGRVVWTCQSKVECKSGIQFESIEI